MPEKDKSASSTPDSESTPSVERSDIPDGRSIDITKIPPTDIPGVNNSTDAIGWTTMTEDPGTTEGSEPPSDD